jgi:dihydroneopterin aldolase
MRSRWPLLLSALMWDREPDDDFEEIDEDDLGDDRAASSPAVSIEITGLSLYTHHGVGEAEREVGQRLVFDISFELDDCDATVADRLIDRFGAESVRVKAAKPEPPIPLPVDEVSVEVWKEV